MRVIILTGEQANQAALCHKIAARCDVAAIVLSANIPRRSPALTRRARLTLNRIAGRLAGRAFVAAWRRLLASYAKLYPSFPDVPTVRVRNVNDDETLRAIEKYAPDLVVVSGTNLVGRKVIELASRRKGIVNLHTGISPYVKGGPNCTNWCLAEGDFHLIGNTVMWLDPGIDTGKIIATERTPLDGRETFDELHWKVMEHAHDLYVRAIDKLARGEAVPAVAQSDVAEGRTFYNAEWGARAMLRAQRNYRRHYAAYFADARGHDSRAAALKLFPLGD
jgi:methionyl-tRNA formyltransferase